MVTILLNVTDRHVGLSGARALQKEIGVTSETISTIQLKNHRTDDASEKQATHERGGLLLFKYQSGKFRINNSGPGGADA